MAQSTILQAIIQAIPADFADPDADYLAVRSMFAPFHGHPVAEDLQLDLVEYGGIRCGHYTLPSNNSALTVFHCHGGAFVSCPLDTYHFYGEMITRQTECSVVMPDYRLAPEHLWPAAQNDCFDAFCGLVESGVDPQTIVLMGESCGGSLAVGLLLRLRDEKKPMPACFVSLTGWFDLSVNGEPVAGKDPFLTPQWVRRRGQDYVDRQLELDDPRVSPAYADLTGLPPLHLQVAEHDTVRQGALTLAKRARASGVDVTIEEWPGMIHGWQGLVNSDVPEAVAAWEAINRYLERFGKNQY